MRYNYTKRLLVLDNDNINPLKDSLEIQGEFFFLEELYDSDARIRGGNSFIFRAVHPDGSPNYIVKFSRYLSNTQRPSEIKRNERFQKEIEALWKASTSPERDCVVGVIDDGRFELGMGVYLRYYVMEEADANLRKFLRENQLSQPAKILLCRQLLAGLNALHGIDIYHRDIKPENILIIGNRWKFGDLGLISYRNEHPDPDHFDEKVGPTGFLSPEATNKAFGNRKCQNFDFDCLIDGSSDLFQLGQLFWFILQDEVPIGQISIADFKCAHAGIFNNIIERMLQYPKNRRPSINDLEVAFQPILQEFGL
jgi:serine/threonine protein kinase